MQKYESIFIGDPTLTDDADMAIDEGTPGNYTVTYTAEDASGNSDTDTRGVTVVDTTPPPITCPADVTLDADPLTCEATYFGPSATATDACDASIQQKMK